MEEKRSDIPLLLVVLLLFSISVGILHGRKNNKVQAKLLHGQASDNEFGLSKLPAEEIVGYFQPLIFARGIGALADTMQQFSMRTMYDVVQILLDDMQSPLTREDKLTLLFVLALYYYDSKKVQSRLFDFILQYQDLIEGSPLLLVAVQSHYAEVIPMLLAWSQHRQVHKIFAQGAQTLITQAFNTAIDENNLEIILTLYAYGVRISSEQASVLLWQVVNANKDIGFVPFLVKLGADVNYIADDKYTPLIRAVANNNKALVQVLLDEGADSTLFVDPEIGSARQIAIVNGYQDIEKLLDVYESS